MELGSSSPTHSRGRRLGGGHGLRHGLVDRHQADAPVRDHSLWSRSPAFCVDPNEVCITLAPDGAGWQPPSAAPSALALLGRRALDGHPGVHINKCWVVMTEKHSRTMPDRFLLFCCVFCDCMAPPFISATRESLSVCKPGQATLRLHQDPKHSRSMRCLLVTKRVGCWRALLIVRGRATAQLRKRGFLVSPVHPRPLDGVAATPASSSCSSHRLWPCGLAVAIVSSASHCR